MAELNSATAAYTNYFLYYLNILREEISQYPGEESLWILQPGTSNSGGTLVLHLLGNLQHFIGKAIGDADYRRDRTREFSARNVPRNQLLTELEVVEKMIKKSMRGLKDKQLSEMYPDDYWPGTTLTLAESLQKLTTHLAYHTGQINYHRRWIEATTED